MENREQISISVAPRGLHSVDQESLIHFSRVTSPFLLWLLIVWSLFFEMGKVFPTLVPLHRLVSNENALTPTL